MLQRTIKVLSVIALVLFALWFRLYFQATTYWDRPIRADAGQYYSIAWNILNHGVYSMTHPSDTEPPPDTYRSPGYPMLVVLAMQIGGEAQWIKMLLFLQALLGALTVALTVVIAQNWMRFGFAFTAGLLLAVWPHSVALSGLFLTETLFGFTLMLAVFLLGWAHRGNSLLRYILAGLACGYCALVNAVILAFPLLVTHVLVARGRGVALGFLVSALLLPGVWAVYSATIESERTSGGRLVENVLAGMEPDFGYLDSPAEVAARERVMAGSIKYRAGDFYVLDELFDRLAEDPAHHAQWYFIGKPARLWQWSILGHGDVYVFAVFESPFQTQPFYRAVIALCQSLNPWLLGCSIGYVVLFALGLARRQPRAGDFPLLLAVLLFVYATLVYSILTPDPRYATPFRPVEIMLAISLLAWIFSLWKKGEREASVGSEPREPA